MPRAAPKPLQCASTPRIRERMRGLRAFRKALLLVTSHHLQATRCFFCLKPSHQPWHAQFVEVSLSTAACILRNSSSSMPIGMAKRVKPDSCEPFPFISKRSPMAPGLAEPAGHDEHHGEDHPQGVLRSAQGARGVGVEGTAAERGPQGLQGAGRAEALGVGVDRLRKGLQNGSFRAASRPSKQARMS